MSDNKRIWQKWEQANEEAQLRVQAAGILNAPPPRLRDPRPGKWKTYLVSVDGSQTVKIGIAKDPKARMATLQTGHPMELSLLWSCEGDYERELHEAFARLRVRGEWFDLTPLGDPVTAVRAVVATLKASAQQVAQ
ncbi:GIY-YIG nuclease family protein [Streptomyces griseoaurantiacus]|uniref:GIY-YIG nuclease family protein n=1 Tax=Streptomyces griseoaurantiacus TaxID=68213 RepID=UPI0036E97D25